MRKADTIRRSTHNGQLAPLANRLTPSQLATRPERIVARRKMAMAVGLARQATAILQRGFWGRLKWAFRAK